MYSLTRSAFSRLVRGHAAIVSLCGMVAALSCPSPAGAEDQSAILELIVNGVPSGERLVVLRSGDAVVPVAALTEAGLRGFTGRRETIDREELVSLASLAPAITFAIDERELRVRIDAKPELLATRVSDLASPLPAGLVFRRDRSAFVNYSAAWIGNGAWDLATESGVNIRGALVNSTLSASAHHLMRGLTNLTIDDRSRLRRWVFGDSFAQTDALGGSAFIAGATVTKEFGVDPYFVQQPRLSIATPVTTPSVVEVYVNGRIISQASVAPGRIDLRNLPLTRGRNDATVVVRDAFGATRELSTDYYFSTTALAQGVHSYQYSVGWVRDSLERSWGYSAPALLARHRLGLTDVITAGGRVEAARGLVSGGPAVNLRLPYGEVEASAAMSHSPRGAGSAAIVSYVYTNSPIGGGASFMLASDRYSVLGRTDSDQRATREVQVFGSVPVAPRTTASLQYNSAAFETAPSRTRVSMLATMGIGSHVNLTLTTARVRDEGGLSHEVFAGLTMPFGRTVASASAGRDTAGRRAGVDVMRALPVGEGYGYQLRTEDGARNMVAAVAQMQNRYGRYEVRQDTLDGRQHVRLQAAGALVAIGGGVFATRPLRSSFALVRVPQVKGVRGFASNQEVGRTNADGNLLIPDLEAYYGNILRIADEDVPLSYSVGATRLTLAPPFRGGAVARFAVKVTRRITGSVRIVTAAGERVPAHGRLTVRVDRRVEISPVGNDGEFYFEDLPGGRLPATIEDEHGTCEFILLIPAADTLAVDLGATRCTVGEAP